MRNIRFRCGMVENVHRYRTVLIGLVFVFVSVLQITFYFVAFRGTQHLTIDEKEIGYFFLKNLCNIFFFKNFDIFLCFLKKIISFLKV